MAFEYRVITLTNDKETDLAVINQMGQDGWRVIQNLDDGELLFMREKPGTGTGMGPSEYKEQVWRAGSA